MKLMSPLHPWGRRDQPRGRLRRPSLQSGQGVPSQQDDDRDRENHDCKYQDQRRDFLKDAPVCAPYKLEMDSESYEELGRNLGQKHINRHDRMMSP
jgi:hypothetical protein